MPDKNDTTLVNDDGNQTQTYTQAELDRLITEAKNAAAAQVRRKFENRDNPQVLELQETIESLQSELASSKRAYESLSGKYKSSQTLLKEKEDAITSLNRSNLMDKAKLELDSKLSKYQFADNNILELVRANISGQLNPETLDDGKLSVKIGDKTLEEYLDSYIQARPSFIKSTVIPGQGAKGSDRNKVSPIEGQPITIEQVRLAQQNGTLSTLIGNDPKRAKQVADLVISE